MISGPEWVAIRVKRTDTVHAVSAGGDPEDGPLVGYETVCGKVFISSADEYEEITDFEQKKRLGCRACWQNLRRRGVSWLIEPPKRR